MRLVGATVGTASRAPARQGSLVARVWRVGGERSKRRWQSDAQGAGRGSSVSAATSDAGDHEHRSRVEVGADVAPTPDDRAHEVQGVIVWGVVRFHGR